MNVKNNQKKRRDFMLTEHKMWFQSRTLSGHYTRKLNRITFHTECISAVGVIKPDTEMHMTSIVNLSSINDQE